jgi:hypothetical protein
LYSSKQAEKRNRWHSNEIGKNIRKTFYTCGLIGIMAGEIGVLTKGSVVCGRPLISLRAMHIANKTH